MTPKDQYPEVITELIRHNSFKRSQIINSVTRNQVTPEMEKAAERLCLIPNMGPITALEILFAIGINLE